MRPVPLSSSYALLLPPEKKLPLAITGHICCENLATSKCFSEECRPAKMITHHHPPNPTSNIMLMSYRWEC